MIRNTFKNFANLKFAILLLLIISIFSSIGSLIEQNRGIEFYQNNYTNRIFGLPLWKPIVLLGLDDIYNTWWFLFILFLFGFSLVCCTFIQQLPTLNFSRKFFFYKRANQFNKLEFKVKKTKIFQSRLNSHLLKGNYSIFQQYNTLYAYKGLISRIGPIVVHLSILVVLLGSTLGSLTGFNSQEFVPKTELFHIQNIIRTGNFSLVDPTAFRINDFWSTYKKSGEIKQFYSDISILNGKGLEINRKTISVNNPLISHDLTFYQTDWGIVGLRFKLLNTKFINSTLLQLPLSKIRDSNQKLWMSWLPFTKKNGLIIIIKDGRGQVQIYNKEGKFQNTLNFGETIFNMNNIIITLLDCITSTGIQIKVDPGINLIYFGFFFLILSSLISYTSFSEIWLLNIKKNTQHMFGGRTNRSKISFKIELVKLKQLFNDNTI
uniref:Cytochrome c biogenesis protein Ccs1 n=1 Tax=Schizocladia ischiensis TaxID=196139 RepID=A0A7S6U9T7_9STRA|nr:ccs1 [Schizocladia ischiensis]QOW07477.1 ccs1 [Schizocladia ischiensis]